MADLARLQDALQQADAAGDTAAAQAFADEIRRMQAAPVAPPAASPQAPPPTLADRALQVANLPQTVGRGAAETIAHLGSGMASTIAGGLAGLGTLQNPQAGLDRAADAVRGVQQAGTYEPRTQAGQLMTKLATALPELFGKATNWAGEQTTDITGSPLAGAAVNTGLNAGAMALGARVPGVAAERAATANAAAQSAKQLGAMNDAALASMKQAGYKILPSDANARAGTALEAGQTSELANKLSRENQPITNARARKELGLAPDAELTPKVIDQMMDKEGQAYAKLKATGEVMADRQFGADLDSALSKGTNSFKAEPPQAFKDLRAQYDRKVFSAEDAVNEVRTLRRDAGKNLKSKDTSVNDIGRAQKAVAEAIESQMERHAVAVGHPELVPAMQAARVQLAKLHAVEDALTPRGDISARVLSKLLEKKVPLSGELKSIAESHKAFPSVLQDPSKLKIPGGGWFKANIPLRTGLASDAYQSTLGPKQYKNPVVAELIGKQNPGGVAAGVGGLTSEEMRRRFMAELLTKAP